MGKVDEGGKVRWRMEDGKTEEGELDDAEGGRRGGACVGEEVALFVELINEGKPTKGRRR